MGSLYKRGDGVQILNDQNFQIRNGTVKIVSGFKGPGVLKAYAVWCPHCQTKVEDFKTLAKAFKQIIPQFQVYVIEADINKSFSNATNIEGFPTMFTVDDNGIIKLIPDAGQINDIVLALCDNPKELKKLIQRAN